MCAGFAISEIDRAPGGGQIGTGKRTSERKKDRNGRKKQHGQRKGNHSDL